MSATAVGRPRLGLAANWRQFTLLVVVNAFVGAMVGTERTVLPLLAKQDFGVASASAVLAFLVAFGITKALANLAAGHLGCGRVQLSLGLVLFTLASTRVPAAQLSLLALVEPTLSPLWAWLIAGELPPLFTFIGGGVILLAIAVQALFSARRRKPAYIYEPG